MHERRILRFPTASGMSIPESDLLAYASGKLEPARSAEIEGFLACNPDLAARIMRERHQQARVQEARRPANTSAARMFRPAQLALACVICLMAGWALAEGLDDDGPFRDLSPVPAYVDDALRSFHVTQVRIGMISQVEDPAVDPAEIQQATRIRLPSFPSDWHLLDMQVFPSEAGPSVAVLAESPGGTRYQLFAVRAATRVGGTPLMASGHEEHAAYWEADGAAYVLAGDASPVEVLAQARSLSRRALL